MKKRDSDKNPFEKKNLVKLAPAAVVIAAVAAAGAQAGSSGKEVTAETRGCKIPGSGIASENSLFL